MLTAMRWLNFPIDTGGLNARGVAYRGKALAIDAEVKFPTAAYSDIQASTAIFRQFGQLRGSAGFELG